MNDKNLLHKFEEKYQISYFLKNTILVSYPKSGRTWLRMMFASSLHSKGYDTDNFELMPAFHYKPSDVIEKIGKNVNVVFLHREPGDVIVSHFMEKTTSTRSGPVYRGTIKNFMRDETLGVDRIIEFNNAWMLNCNVFNSFHVVSYENLKKNCQKELSEIYKFSKFEASEKDIEYATKHSDFKSMKRIELGSGDNFLKSYKGNFGKSPGRVRKGKVDDYLNVLDQEDIDYINLRKKSLYPTLLR